MENKMENKGAFLDSVRLVLQDGGVLLLRQVHWPPDTYEPHLVFEGFSDDNALLCRWRVECGEIDSLRIESHEIYSLEMPVNHVAMCSLYSQNRKLHFTGKTQNLNDLVVDLLKFNEGVTRGLAPVTAYFSTDHGIQGLMSSLESGFGVVASGPEDLLKQYAAILEKYGLKTSIFGEVSARLDNAENLHLGYQMLLWERTSYVIADEFTFIREV